MAKYIISQKAIEDLDGIWEYTLKTWSEEQADRYYAHLTQSIAILTKLPEFLGQDFNIVKPGLWGYHVGRHIIFYRKDVDGTVWIERVLHERMDYNRHI